MTADTTADLTAAAPTEPTAAAPAPAPTKASRRRQPQLTTGGATLQERADALRIVEAWVDEHRDEILLSGGALPDALAAALDEALGDFATKIDAIAAVRRSLKGAEATCKVEKDYYAQREKTFANAMKAITAYAKRAMEFAGEEKVKTERTTAGIVANPPAVRHGYTNDQLLAIDAEADRLMDQPDVPLPRLASYITVQRVATLDTGALLRDYQTRERELQVEAAALWPLEPHDDETTVAEIADVRAARAAFVARELVAEFPGVTVERGTHLRFY